MKGTRSEIVELLRKQGEMTIHSLLDHLSLAPAALRRHLEILVGEGTVEFRSVKQAFGRPFYAYRLSDQGRERLSTGSPRLIERLILEAAALPALDNESRPVLDCLFAGVSDRLVSEHRPQVRGQSLEDRVDSLTVALREEGILDTWSKQEDGFHLYNASCPHHRAARVSSGLCCSSERRAISLLLDTDVEQVGSIAEGRPLCEYIVHLAAADEHGQKNESNSADARAGEGAKSAE